ASPRPVRTTRSTFGTPRRASHCSSVIRHLARNGGPHPQFSPDGKRILTVEPSVDRNDLQIWDTATGEPIGQPLHHDNVISFISFSLDGRFVLTLSGDDKARVWNGLTGENIYTLEQSGGVNCGAFSPDNRHLATGGNNNSVLLWDLSSGKPFSSPFVH